MSVPDVAHDDAIARIEESVIDAGLRHELRWEAVKRILEQLPVDDGCRWCGGWLDRIAGDAWGCRACGRIDTEWARQAADESRPNRAEAEELKRRARESWRRVEVRFAQKGVA